MTDITLLEELSTPVQKSESGTSFTLHDVKSITDLVVKGKTLQTVTVQGKNLTNIPDHKEQVTDSVFNNYFPQSPKVLLQPNTKYTIAFDYKINLASSNVALGVGYGDTYYKKDIVYGEFYPTQTTGRMILAFTTPTTFDSTYGTPYLQLRLARLYQTGDLDVDIAKVIVALGEYSSLPYEPFVPNSPSPDYPASITPTNKVTVNGTDYATPDLYGLPDSTQDIFDVITGQGTKNIGKVTFSGSGAWTKVASNNLVVTFVHQQSDMHMWTESESAYDFYCDKIKPQGTSGSLRALANNYSNYFYLSVFWTDIECTSADSDSTITTKLLAWLSANPVTVVYRLAVPTAITSTPQQITLNRITADISNNTGAEMAAAYSAKFQRVAYTSHAFGATITHELMRAYDLQFSLVNTENMRKYISHDSLFDADGQRFDISATEQNSGSTNVTQITAAHIARRLNYYTVPVGYAFVGTVSQIAQDMLNISTPLKKDDGTTDAKYSHASDEFFIGTCANVSGSFSLGNTEPATVRGALFALKTMGVEVDFDNFTINLPVKCGTGHTHTFKFGKDMCEFNRSWNKSDGSTTYSATIADLQRIPGHESEVFDVGDDAVMDDWFIGDQIHDRIITYAKCLDDPSQNAVVFGEFVRDDYDYSMAMEMNIAAVTETANNSVHVGESYNNVDISHKYGFKSTSADGTSRVFSNGTDGEIEQLYYNGEWVTVRESNMGANGAGQTTWYTVDHTQKMVAGGSTGYKCYKSDGNGGWILTGGMDADGANAASKMYNPSKPYIYAVIGEAAYSGQSVQCLAVHKVWTHLDQNGNVISTEDKQIFNIMNPLPDVTVISGDASNTGLSIAINNVLKSIDLYSGQSQLNLFEHSLESLVDGSEKFSVDSNGPHCSPATGDIYIPAGDGHAAKNVHVSYGVITGWS